jgi:predicted alpha/beta-hydrolase family hydrolase
MVAMTSLEITGYDDQPVPNRFYRQDQAAAKLGVLLPGLGYNCDMPLLYYPTKLLLARGADVLQLRPDYNTLEFQSLPGEERACRAGADASAALRVGLAQRDYAQVVLVGKSIGTMALAHLVSTEARLADAVTVWLTPVFRGRRVVEAALQFKGPALFVAGTGDTLFDAEAMSKARETTGAQVLTVEGADHSMEIVGDPLRSLGVLDQVVRAIADLFDRHGITAAQ